MNYLAKRYEDGTYVAIANGGIIANGSRPIAHRALREHVSGLEADRILNTKVADAVWRKAFVAAAASKGVNA